ncbi:MAG: hypothetical protein DHS20C02_18200 [Micavibrio sp.]|nr:MAG: hypothetical protein DHS20C02_18200 [Micavibrio sp.]
MAEKAKSNNVMIMAAVGAAVVILGLGGYMYQKSQNTKTVSLSVGGESISATFGN